jgi:hypothetical protein
MMFNITDSLYSSSELEKAAKAFFGHDTGLFGPAMSPGHGQISTRVAVTSSIGYAETMTLISNYNHPQGKNASREEDPSKDMRVWEAAMATSAAPYYLPPFRKAETATMYVDGAVFANCPAATAYAETRALWPKRAAELDFLVSLSTGRQGPRDGGGLQKFIPNNILRTCTNLLMHQSNSNESWETFEGDADPEIRPKLLRLDPTITDGGDRIALDDYKKMDDLVGAVKKWASFGEGLNRIEVTMHSMLASLFFFEPDVNSRTGTADSATTGLSRTTEVGRLPYSSKWLELSGTIRCRLPHNSHGLRKLLGERAESLWCSVVDHGEHNYWSSEAEKTPSSLHWDEISTTPEGSTQLTDCIDKQTQTCRVNVNFTFRDEKHSRRLHVLGLKVKGSKRIIPISGFPSTMTDLIERTNFRWLQ